MNIKTETLYQPNAVTQLRYSFNEYEMRILLYIISRLQNQMKKTNIETLQDLINEQQNLILQFEIKELKINDEEQNHTRIKNALISLRKQDMEIITEHTVIDLGFVNYSQYNKKLKIWEIEISRKLMPYLISTAQGFTTYEVKTILLLNNQAQRLYMMMCQWKSTGYFIINAEKLKKILKLDNSYKRYCDFKRAVLTRAENKLKNLFNEGNSTTYFKLIKDEKNRNATSDFDRDLEFIITSNKEKPKKIENRPDKSEEECKEILNKIANKTTQVNKEKLISIYHQIKQFKQTEAFTKRLHRFKEECNEKRQTMEERIGVLFHFAKNDFKCKLPNKNK